MNKDDSDAIKLSGNEWREKFNYKASNFQEKRMSVVASRSKRGSLWEGEMGMKKTTAV